jgi:hypothetical protein
MRTPTMVENRPVKHMCTAGGYTEVVRDRPLCPVLVERDSTRRTTRFRLFG